MIGPSLPSLAQLMGVESKAGITCRALGVAQQPQFYLWLLDIKYNNVFWPSGKLYQRFQMSVSVEQVVKMVKENEGNENFKVVDVRTQDQRDQGHIANSLHVPVGQVQKRVGEFKKEATYLVYCKAGGRSKMATDTLKAHGFNAINMEGGYDRWSTMATNNQKECCIIY